MENNSEASMKAQQNESNPEIINRFGQLVQLSQHQQYQDQQRQLQERQQMIAYFQYFHQEMIQRHLEWQRYVELCHLASRTTPHVPRPNPIPQRLIPESWPQHSGTTSATTTPDSGIDLPAGPIPVEHFKEYRKQFKFKVVQIDVLLYDDFKLEGEVLKVSVNKYQDIMAKKEASFREKRMKSNLSAKRSRAKKKIALQICDDEILLAEGEKEALSKELIEKQHYIERLKKILQGMGIKSKSNDEDD